MPRPILITQVSDLIANRQKNTILSAYAIGKIFTGNTIEALDLDTYIIPGIIRVDSAATHGPDYIDPKGFLHTSTINSDEDTTADADKYIIRQTLYPDDADFNPQTRLGTGTSNTDPISTIVWSEWTEMGGGGFLKRLELTESMTGVGTSVAQPNILYYSYHNYDLYLPDPNNYRLGTRIGLEQIANDVDVDGNPTGTGHVIYGSLDQATSADYKANLVDGEVIVTNVLIGSLIYYFTVAEESEISSNKAWVLEFDNNYKELISSVNDKINVHKADTDDPHPQYLKKTSLDNVVSSSTTTAITPKGVQDALTSQIVDMTPYVAKVDLYTPATTIIKAVLLPTATTSAYGAVKIATDVDVNSMNGVAADTLPTVSQLQRRRLIHFNTYLTTTNTVISEADLNTKNPMYTVLAEVTKVISLPTPTAAMVSRVATVYIDIVRGIHDVAITVTCAELGLSELFSNTKDNSTIQLVFEASYNTSNSYTWKLVL